ncbi:hypothetical protein HPB47_019247 [Ixodes persulcatus]|uniref:Uncharacterized protein n=2 Tax=Ixodes persulcatus TaxID=34615 RepID=A0AC60QIP5_IXOPE|nr:hypothetical protein HPB47_019247 [Ixodes persulcatus]
MASPSAPPASPALSKSKTLKPRVSSIQLDILISFMEDHPQLARACTELTAEFTRDRRTLWWAELVRRLNSQGPANKTRAEWQQFWGAKVRVAKSKAGILNEDGRGTGGGPPRGSPLTPEEERILGILGVDTVQGCGGPVLGLEGFPAQPDAQYLVRVVSGITPSGPERSQASSSWSPRPT